MRKFAIGIVLLLALTSAALAEQVVNRIAAVVDEDIITLHEVESMANPVIADMLQKNPDMSAAERNQKAAQIKQDVLRGLIEQKLIEREVARLGIEVTDGEITSYIERIKKANNYSDDTLRLALGQQGITMDEFRDRIQKEIMREQYVSFRMRDKVRVTEEEVRAYYDHNQEEFAAEPVMRIAEIRVNVAPDASEEQVRENFALINDVYQKLLAGENFEEMAKQYSQGPTASDGGTLGSFKLQTELKPVYRRAAEPLAEGAFSTVFRDTNGFFILKLAEKTQTGVIPFEEVTDRIEMILRKQKAELEMERLAAELYKKSYVDIRINFAQEQ